MSYKIFSILLTCLSISICAIIASINYLEDPAMIFSQQQKVYQVADWIVAGHDVAICSNVDERLMQKSILEKIPNKDVLVFGSSRIMALNETAFPGKTFYNAGVSGGSLEDMIGLFHVYSKTHDHIPKIVVIGLEPWLLNDNNDQSRYQSIKEDFNNGIHMMTGRKEIQKDNTLELKKYNQLLSRKYLSASIKKFRNKESVYFTLADNRNEVPDNAGIITHDGSHIWSKNENKKSSELVEQEVIHSIQGNFYSMENYTYLSSEKKSLFLTFIRFLKSNDVTVICYKEPYHPIAYEHLVSHKKYAALSWANAWFDQNSSLEGYNIIGSYNPDDMHLDGKDFTDFMHMRADVQLISMKRELADL